MMEKEQTAEMKKLIRKMTGLSRRIFNANFRGDYDKTLKYIEQEE